MPPGVVHRSAIPTGAELNLHLYLRLLRNGAWIIATLAVLGALAGAASAYLTPPTYNAQNTVYLTVSGASSAGDLQAGNVYVMQKAATYASLATTTSVLSDAATALGDGSTVDQLRGAVSVAAAQNSGIITVSGAGSVPAQVAGRANAVAEALVQRIASSSEQPVRTSGSGSSPATSLRVLATVVQPAVTPTVAAAPQPRYSTFAGFVVGLAVALAILVLRYALDTRIYRLTDLPADRSLVTRTSIPPRPGRFTRGAKDEVQLESFRALRANLQFGTDIGRSIAVAPVGPEGDARWVAVELCRVFAEIGQQVLFIDADLRPQPERGPRDAAGPAAQAGLAQLLTQTTSVSEVLSAMPSEDGVVHAIPAGRTTDRSSQLLSTPTMRELLSRLEQSYSAVVLLCPPLVERADATVVAALASSTLVVVRGSSTKRGPLRFALGLLAGVRARSVSVVLENAQVS